MKGENETASEIVAEMRDLAANRDWHNHTAQSNRERIENLADRLEDALASDAELAADDQWAPRHEKPTSPAPTAKIDENTSDGYHTFKELYRYRMLYNAAFFNLLAQDVAIPVVKSRRHSDGEECFGGGWFIVVAELPTGQVSNHYEEKYWDLFRIPAVERAPKWDGHTPNDAADRLEVYCLPAQYSVEIEQRAPGDAQKPADVAHGNAAKMREAMEWLREIIGDWNASDAPIQYCQYCNALDNIDAALSEPPRNCDRYANVHDAAIAFSKLRNVPHPCPDFTFSTWLMDKAEGGAA